MNNLFKACKETATQFLGGNLEMENKTKAPGLFANCAFALVISDNFPADDVDKVARTLRIHDGIVVGDRFDGDDLPLSELTHIICATCDFPSYDAATDALISVIRPLWVDASLAKSKLAQTRQYSPNPRLIMSDVVICCIDLPEGDSEAMIGGVMAMGGLHTTSISAQTTHLVALTMESRCCQVAVARKLNLRIVLPHWFDACLRLGRRIDEGPYCLPDPEILRPPYDARPRAMASNLLNGALETDPTNVPSPRGPLQVFSRKRVMLAQDLGIGIQLRAVVEALIKESNGKVINDAKTANMYICKYREGADYRLASQLGKDVGNLSWLYYLITNNKWTSPTRRLLHYPVARGGLPGFKDLRISLSNYSGDARLYLNNLIQAAGAECTKTLKETNTHLITAHIESEKCAAARDWGVALVNHLWLEESYASWQLQSLTNDRYTHFPKRTNLGEIVGQTQIDRNALKQHFFHAEDVEMKDADDDDEELQLQPDDSGMIADPPMSDHKQTNHVPASSVFTTPKIPHVKQKPLRTGPNQLSRAGSASSVQTPAARKILVDGKENQTPSSSGRKSKEVASARLQGYCSDIALYEKEKKRKGGVVYGGRRKTDEDRVSVDKKRSFEEDPNSDSSEYGDAKRRNSGILSTPMYLLISGYKKWVGHPKLEQAERTRLRNLGINVIADPRRATHLAAPAILRTQKFVSAMAYAPVIISTDFIERCLEDDAPADPEEFILNDKANEKRFMINLADSRKRAQQNKNKLFDGWTIYCVESINGGFDTYKSIVEANGGKCNSYRGRPGTMVPSRRADSDSTANGDDEASAEVYLISGTDDEHKRVWSRFQQMAEGTRNIPKIVRTEWLLESAMGQRVLPSGGFEIG